MAFFADINVSQSSVATHAKCGGIFNIHLTANLPRNLPIFFLNRLRFDRIMVMSLWPRFFGPPYKSSTSSALCPLANEVNTNNYEQVWAYFSMTSKIAPFS